MFYILQTIPGLAKLAWREAEERLPPVEGKGGPTSPGTLLLPGRNDLILVNYDGNPRALLKLRVSEDAFAVAARTFNVASDERGPRQIYAAVSKTRYAGDALNAWKQAVGGKRVPRTFRVVAREAGAHGYQRRIVAKAVADAVREGWPGKLRPVEEEADLELWATLVDRELFCAIRLSGPEMRQREKQRHVPASLRPALAAAMVMLTEPAPGDVFLDPMAGAGTLLLERAAAGPFAALLGGDTSTAALEALRINTRSLRGEVSVERWDARRLPIDDGTIDKVAANMPFGHQIAPGEDLGDLYRSVLREVARVLRPGGRFVTLVGEPEVLEEARQAAARTLRPAGRQRIEILGRPALICVFRRS